MIFVRAAYVGDVRVLREELIHVHQQKTFEVGGAGDVANAEFEARLLMSAKRHEWRLTNDEIREMIRDIWIMTFRRVARRGRPQRFQCGRCHSGLRRPRTSRES
jgi:hypothetical protein